jgi:hypothetical protein
MSEFGLVRYVGIYRRFQQIVSNKHEAYNQTGMQYYNVAHSVICEGRYFTRIH